MKRFSGFWKILKTTWTEWKADDPFRQSAVIAYYAIFSLPALLVLVINVAGIFFGKDVVGHEITRQIGSLMGHDTAESVGKIVEKAQQSKAGVIANIIAVATILFGATGVFVQLQKELNQIWDVQQKPNAGIMANLRSQLLSFGLILTIGFLLLISMVVSTALAAFSTWMNARFSGVAAVLLFIVDFVVSYSIISLLFAAMFKTLPDVKMPWRTIWTGSMITGLLFLLGKYALSFYFGKAHPGSVYGAAGSVVLILLWVSYSSMIVFFGAEFTKQFAVYHHVEVTPTKNAEPIEAAEKKKQVGELDRPESKDDKRAHSERKTKPYSFAVRRRTVRRYRLEEPGNRRLRNP